MEADAGRIASLHAAWETHQGYVRERNEDLACLVRLREHHAIAAAVLDGMGGHGGGDVAARIGAHEFRRAWRTPLPSDPMGRYEWMLSAFYAAHDAIRKYGARTLGLGGMGATAAAVLATPEGCLLMHAGDCRVYHFRRGQLQYVTADHTIVRILLEKGHITEDQVATHPMRSVVTSCLGGGSEARLSVDPKWEDGGGPAFRSLSPGDTILLCSDGLWSEVSQERLSTLVAQFSGKPRLLAKACKQAALDAGAHDNVTVAAICVRAKGHPRPARKITVRAEKPLNV